MSTVIDNKNLLNEISPLISSIQKDDNSIVVDISNAISSFSNGKMDYHDCMLELCYLSAKYKEPMVWDIMSHISNEYKQDPLYFIRMKYNTGADMYGKGDIFLAHIDFDLDAEFVEYVWKKYRYNFNAMDDRLLRNALFNEIGDFPTDARSVKKIDYVYKTMNKLDHVINENSNDFEFGEKDLEFLIKVINKDENSKYGILTFAELNFFENLMNIVRFSIEIDNRGDSLFIKMLMPLFDRVLSIKTKLFEGYQINHEFIDLINKLESRIEIFKKFESERKLNKIIEEKDKIIAQLQTRLSFYEDIVNNLGDNNL